MHPLMKIGICRSLIMFAFLPLLCFRCPLFSDIKDIHSVLDVSVYDEDRDRRADFLGKVAIPLLAVSLIWNARTVCFSYLIKFLSTCLSFLKQVCSNNTKILACPIHNRVKSHDSFFSDRPGAGNEQVLVRVATVVLGSLSVSAAWGERLLGVFIQQRLRDRHCHVLFPQIQNGEEKAYILKNKNLTGASKGVIYLEMDVVYNVVSVNFAFLYWM